MDQDLHRMLKALAASYDCTISELVALMTEPAVNKLGLYCTIASEVFNWQQYPLHPKGDKWCWGTACVNCKHRKGCDAGDYTGTFVSSTPEHMLQRPSDKALGVPKWIDDAYVEDPFHQEPDV